MSTLGLDPSRITPPGSPHPIGSKDLVHDLPEPTPAHPASSLDQGSPVFESGSVDTQSSPEPLAPSWASKLHGASGDYEWCELSDLMEQLVEGEPGAHEHVTVDSLLAFLRPILSAWAHDRAALYLEQFRTKLELEELSRATHAQLASQAYRLSEHTRNSEVEDLLKALRQRRDHPSPTSSPTPSSSAAVRPAEEDPRDASEGHPVADGDPHDSGGPWMVQGGHDGRRSAGGGDAGRAGAGRDGRESGGGHSSGGGGGGESAVAVSPLGQLQRGSFKAAEQVELSFPICDVTTPSDGRRRHLQDQTIPQISSAFSSSPFHLADLQLPENEVLLYHGTRETDVQGFLATGIAPRFKSNELTTSLAFFTTNDPEHALVHAKVFHWTERPAVLAFVAKGTDLVGGDGSPFTSRTIPATTEEDQKAFLLNCERTKAECAKPFKQRDVHAVLSDIIIAPICIPVTKDQPMTGIVQNRINDGGETTPVRQVAFTSEAGCKYLNDRVHKIYIFDRKP